MKNQQIINFYQKLQKVNFYSITNGKFQYAIAKNRIKLEHEFEELEKVKKALAPEEYEKLVKEITEIVQNAIKDASESEYIEIQQECINKWKKYKQWIEVTNKYDSLIVEMYNQESDISFHLIDLKLIETLPLNEEQMSVIIDFIKE